MTIEPARTIVLSAGGTGGHLYPAEALAQELLRRHHRVVIITDARGHAFKSLGAHVDIHVVPAATLSGGVIGCARAITRMLSGIFKAAKLLQRIKPDIVIGFGGYPSVPGVLAAQILRIPTALHEQNAVLGKANAFLARHARLVATAFPDTRGTDTSTPTAVTGNPVRDAICAARDVPYPDPTHGTLRLLITGGSQAARIFGEIVPVALTLLPQDLRTRLHVMHQSRADAVEATQAAYTAGSISAEVAPFFVDMAGRLSACHLFIGRGGASTVVEAAVVGRPAIFVPLPTHKDQQQLHNANTLARCGGAWVIEQRNLTPHTLAALLQDLFCNPDTLTRAAAAAKACGEPQAARKLADALAALLATPPTRR